MALVKCGDCGKKMSEKAATCPKCGAPPPVIVAKKSNATILFFIFIALFIVTIFLSNIGGNTGSATLNVPVVSDKQQKEHQDAEDRFQKASQMGALLKTSMREPESVEWISINANEDASVICFEYKGKNGFGGVGFENSVVANGKVFQSAAMWNKKCAGKKMYDVTHAGRNMEIYSRLYKQAR